MSNSEDAQAGRALGPDSLFDRVWQTSGRPDSHASLPEMLGTLEHELDLEPGFLTNDDIITQKMKDLLDSHGAGSKEGTLQLLADLLSEIKVVDLSQRTVYGDFSDDYNFYKDNRNIFYEKLCSKSEIMLHELKDVADIVSTDMASVETPKLILREDDSDDSASLMEFEIPYDAFPQVCDRSGEFRLHKMLEELNVHHHTINLNFKHIDTKLKVLREQNVHDMEFLTKLSDNNEFMRDRIFDIRSELDELNSVFEDVKMQHQRNEVVLMDAEDVISISSFASDLSDRLIGTELCPVLVTTRSASSTNEEREPEAEVDLERETGDAELALERKKAEKCPRGEEDKIDNEKENALACARTDSEVNTDEKENKTEDRHVDKTDIQDIQVDKTETGGKELEALTRLEIRQEGQVGRVGQFPPLRLLMALLLILLGYWHKS